MDLHHKFVVPAGFDVAWDAFNDLEGLVPCVPGGELTAAEGDTFSGTVKVKLGPISMLYGGPANFLSATRPLDGWSSRPRGETGAETVRPGRPWWRN